MDHASEGDIHLQLAISASLTASSASLSSPMTAIRTLPDSEELASMAEPRLYVRPPSPAVPLIRASSPELDIVLGEIARSDGEEEEGEQEEEEEEEEEEGSIGGSEFISL